MNGILSLSDRRPHISQFLGHIGYAGYSELTDLTYLFQASAYIISDTTRVYPDMTFVQGVFLGRGDPIGYVPTRLNVPAIDWTNLDPTARWSSGDPPLYLRDYTYVGGVLGADGTYRDGTWLYYWYDPVWINYSLWYTQDGSNNQLIGNRYREPVRLNVGNYYISMEVPRTTGHYEIRWRYEKDNSSYAHEVVQGFWCKSTGIDPDRT